MQPLRQWPPVAVTLVAIGWVAVIVVATSLLTDTNFGYTRTPDGTQIWSAFISGWPRWVYWLVLAPPLALILWRVLRRAPK